MSSRHVYKLPKHGPVPVEALELNDAIGKLGACIRFLQEIDPRHIHPDFKLGKELLGETCTKLRTWRSYANGVMRHEFLDPRKKRIER